VGALIDKASNIESCLLKTHKLKIRPQLTYDGIPPMWVGGDRSGLCPIPPPPPPHTYDSGGTLMLAGATRAVRSFRARLAVTGGRGGGGGTHVSISCSLSRHHLFVCVRGACALWERVSPSRISDCKINVISLSAIDVCS
jgi:hypothetical protein